MLIDEAGAEGIVAKSSADAPEIDGAVTSKATRKARVGDFVQVRVTHSDAHDLYAQVTPGA